MTKSRNGEAERIDPAQGVERSEGASDRQLYHAAIRAMSEGFVLHAPDGSIQMANPSAEEILGLTLDQMTGRTGIDPRWRLVRPDGSALPPEEIPSEITRCTGMPCTRRLLGVHRATGELAWLHVSTDPVGPLGQPGLPVVATFTDISEQRALEVALKSAQRREAMADLAAGIAHNFNNLLTIIVPGIELALRTASSQERGFLIDARSAAQRAVELVRELLALGRQGAAGQEDRTCDVAEVVRDVLRLCRMTFDRKIAIEEHIHASPAWVSGSSSQLHQIVLNLCVNARDALDGASEPQLAVEVRRSACADNADEIVLQVRDNGSGMDDATLARLGQPFFTTKGAGSGTGLGLSSVYGAARSLGGSVECTSRQGEGTTFTVRLPALVTREAQPEAAIAEPPIKAATQRVLLVDDEPLVRKVVRSLLELTGRTVVEACGGAEALDLLERGDSFDAVLLDLSLPGMSGREVLAELRARHPELPVIILSGYIAGGPALEGARAVLQKPVMLAELARTFDALAP